jgi:hypothetical protein
MRANRAFFHQSLYCVGVAIVNNALMFMLQQPSHHIGAHAAQANHSDLH